MGEALILGSRQTESDGIDYTSSTCPYFRLATNSQGATGAPGDTITISFLKNLRLVP